jgi:hypothetical protein
MEKVKPAITRSLKIDLYINSNILKVIYANVFIYL